MDFKQALKEMKQGKKIKLPSWGGYWTYDSETDSIYIHCKEGNILEFRETERLSYTLDNVLSDEWIIANEQNTPILGGVATFSFGEAIKYLKRGFKVARQGWNGKGMFLFLTKNMDLDTDADLSCCNDLEDDELVLPSIAIKTADNKFVVGWLASETDILAEDWVFVE